MGKSIILVGFMGVGKTSLGKKLANKLNYTFLDTDQFIEKKENLSVSEIFEKKGEEYFRQLENELVSNLPCEKHVIATGGGLPCRKENIYNLNKCGITIYLHRPVKELAARLSQAKNKRPLIAALTDEELLEFIDSKLEEREPFYNQCQIIANRNQQTPENLIELIP